MTVLIARAFSFSSTNEILFFIDLIELYIFFCFPPCLYLPLQPSPMVSMLSIYSGELVFYYFPRRLDPYMSLLGSWLL